MIDRTRAVIAAAAVGAVVVLAVFLGFVAGRAGTDSSDDDQREAGVPLMEGDGLPAGPSGIDNGVPVGFARSEEGAIAAAVTWAPLLSSGPSAERPEGATEVVAAGAEIPGVGSDVTIRALIVPFAAKVAAASHDETTVEILAVLSSGDLDAEVDFTLTSAAVTLTWDEAADDWRVTDITGTGEPEPPLSAAEAADYRVVRPSGGGLGGVLIEEVPGE